MHSKRAEENEEESATLVALAVEGDSVLDICLKQDYRGFLGGSVTNELMQ